MRQPPYPADHAPMAGPGRTDSAAPVDEAGAEARPPDQHELARPAFVKAATLLGAGGFLAAGGLVGLNSLARVSAAADLDTATAEELARRQWAFVIDLRRCD